MKILMIAPFDVSGRYKGGIHSIVNSLIAQPEYLKQFGAEIVPFNTCIVERTDNDTGKISFSNIMNFAKIYNDLPRTIKITKPDLIYYHSSRGLALLKDALIVRNVKRKTGIKAILHIHFADFDKIMIGVNFIDKFTLRILKKNFEKIVFLSRNTARSFIEKGIPEMNTAVLYNFSTIEYPLEVVEKKMSKSMNIPFFLFVGSIDRRKGIFDLLKCLSKREENYVLHICGECPDSETKKKLNRYKDLLGEKLVLHGYVSGATKSEIFLDSDVVVLPSYGEGLPMVILEAFHAGCAVLTTRVGAIPEIVSKENGILINPGNESELMQALDVIFGNAISIQSMKRNNAFYAKKFTLASFVKQMVSICEGVL